MLTNVNIYILYYKIGGVEKVEMRFLIAANGDSAFAG